MDVLALVALLAGLFLVVAGYVSREYQAIAGQRPARRPGVLSEDPVAREIARDPWRYL